MTAILYTKVSIAQILQFTTVLNNCLLNLQVFNNQWNDAQIAALINGKSGIHTVFIESKYTDWCVLTIIFANNNFYKRMPVCLKITALIP